MSLKHAILGFIDMRPVSGYDLKAMFDASVQFYWSATHTQIYRTLNDLTDRELITFEVVQQTGRPNKKIYSITPEGKTELLKWLRSPLSLPILHHASLIKIGWADNIETEEIISLLKDYQVKIQEQLRLLETENRQQVDQYAKSPREARLWTMILENGLGFYRHELSWTREIIAQMEDFMEQGGKDMP